MTDDDNTRVPKKDPALYRYLRRYTGDSEDIRMKELYEIIDQYRILSNMTWKEFIYLSIAKFAEEDNIMLAEEIRKQVRTFKKPGRPVGSSKDMKLMKMGIDPSTVERR